MELDKLLAVRLHLLCGLSFRWPYKVLCESMVLSEGLVSWALISSFIWLRLRRGQLTLPMLPLVIRKLSVVALSSISKPFVIFQALTGRQTKV